jgi:hypothetical protein
MIIKIKCDKCGKDTEHESTCPDNDGCHEDYRYECKECHKVTWDEGSDY